MPLAHVTHGFLEGEGPLFAAHHAPTGPARDVAWVLCQPLHLDLIQSHRSMRRCAEELAAAGFHVLRFDYEGTGESIGSTDRDPGRVEAWLSSVRRAVAVMAKIPGIQGVGLLGVRIGATFALEATTHLDVARLVSWEACPGASYAREMEILASSAPQRLTGGLVAGGYWLSEATLAELARLDLQKMQPRGKPDVLLVHRGDRKPSPRLQEHLEKHGCRTTSVALAGHKEMMVMPQKSAVPTAILTAIRDWAVQHSSVATEATSSYSVPLAAEVIASDLRWRTLRFGSTRHLFGILTEPAAGAKPGLPAVELLTGGVTPRTAGNRSYVTLAERLASRGHAVLRMDVADIGESATPDGRPGKDNDPFPPSIVDDARAGLEEVCSAVRPDTNVWLLGLCSGAYAAFHTALADRRVKGVFLVNPERFQLGGGDAGEAEGEAGGSSAMSTVDQLEQMNRYWQVMKDPESWKKLLSGKANVRHIATVVGARARSKLESTKERIAVRLGREPKGLARDFGELLARGTSVHLVFSEGDPGHAATVTELGARWDELVGKGLRVTTFAGADHNFHEMASRAELLDWVVSEIPGATSRRATG